MEQRLPQATVAIKEEIAETNCTLKENITQRNPKPTKGIKKEIVDSECPTKIERNSPPPTTANFRNVVSPKNTTQSLSANLSPASTILKTVLTNFPATNSCSAADVLSPPLATTTSSNNISSEFEQTTMSTKTSCKIKRLLSTLLQFANSLNAEVGDSVKTLIFNLACNVITIEEFHTNLQDATNFPLRPFVLPFLKNYIPILQKELVTQAKIAKQNVQQYVKQHENYILEPFCSTAELSEVFNQMETVSSSNQSDSYPNTLIGKRRYDCHETNILNNKPDSPIETPIETPPPTKKAVTSNMYSSLMNGLLCNNQQSSYYTSEYTQIPPPPFLSSGNNWFSSTSLSSSKECNSTSDDRKNAGDNEWNNIYVMLNCILSMVEKTKRALAILQERSAKDNNCNDINNEGINLNGVNGEHGAIARRTTAEDMKRTANELMAHTVRLTEEKVAFVRKKAEEAVNEVKKQAIMELQKAIAATDYKISDCTSTNVSNKLSVSENKKLSSHSEPEYCGNNGYHLNDKIDSLFSLSNASNCWNCGRKAQETCSGCNIARYCGSFCQYKDWESHHQICNGYITPSSINIDKTLCRSSHSDSLLRNNGFNELLSKSNTPDLTNIIRSQNNPVDSCKLLPFSINMTAASSEKQNSTRAIASRPLTPVASTTSIVNSLISTKIKK